MDNIINANGYGKNHPEAGSIKKFVDWHCTILVTQSILLIFALAISTHKFNKPFKFCCEILRNTIKWLSTESKISQTGAACQLLFDVNDIL